MNKYILGSDGMMCGMCEMHVEDTLRKAISIKKVKASHIKNKVEIITEENLTLEDFKKIMDPTGYRITSFEVNEAIKKLFGWK
ncbi:MAG: heavy-metal-associated domain-containing protein [Gammaproteobacteria bacterium]|nr:heavy-metal-associated domain-containing protein [Gammaproteobacteria bacterium]